MATTGAVTYESESVVEAEDFYPYGGQRIDTKTNYGGEKRKYAGTEYDSLSGLNYAMARYQNPQRGQFLSEDPVFLGDPKQQVLTDPQSLNSYSYANDNPITKSDPSGRCPICVAIAIGGGVGLVGGIGAQGFNDYLSGDFGRRSFQDNLSTYGVAGVSGATVRAGVVVAGAASAAAGLTAGVTTLVVGGTAGTLTAGTTVAGDRLLGQQTDYGSLGVSAGISALSAGTLKGLPGVRGRMPSFGTSAFYTGAHTSRQGAEEMFSSSMQSLGQTMYRTAPAFAAGSSYGGSGSSGGSLVQQLQSLVSSLQGLVSSLSSASATNKK